MKNISILVLEEAVLGSIAGPHKVFTEVNDLLLSMGKQPLFDVKLVGVSKETRLNNGLFTVNPELSLNEVQKTDLIIIPAIFGDLPKALELNADVLPWITEQYNKGAEVASLCLGAFVLASTGLLEGRKCSTHWLAENDFKKMFPGVELVADSIITDANGIYSSGGAFSFLNLIMYLVEKFAGRDIAVISSKIFQVELDRDSQSPFMMFKGQKEHDDEPIKQIQGYIETNYQEKLTVEQLASMFAVSRRSLERRFKKATSNSVIEYIQRVKVEAAKMSLESSKENINEVMYKIGYTDIKAFRNTFKKFTGLSPVQYRNRYYRELIRAIN